MLASDYVFDDIYYEKKHVAAVLDEVDLNLPKYFNSFFMKTSKAKQLFDDAVWQFENEQESYQELLDLDLLAEYEDDPNAFKSDLRSRCPIIRRCLNSKSEEMKDFKARFRITAGSDLLKVITSIVSFGDEYMKSFDDTKYMSCEDVECTGMSKLQEKEFYSPGVIGEGIKSHILYSLYPSAFANRSRFAIWDLYFLSGRKDFGLRDGSEFIMINDYTKDNLLHNYFYPYDLFDFYALQLFRKLQDAAATKYYFDASLRFVYLDTFLNHVRELHKEDIRYLSVAEENEYWTY